MSLIPDSWYNPPEPEKVAMCSLDECGQEIMEGDDVYIMADDDVIVHKDCFVDYCINNFDFILGVAVKNEGSGLE